MQEDINQFEMVPYEYHTSNLEFSSHLIEVKVQADEKYQGTLSFCVNGPVIAKGSVLTTDVRVTVEQESFEGNKIEIPFCFDAYDLSPGEVKKGIFTIVSNVGEYTIPFEVHVVGAYFVSTLGEVKNLFLFANLARTNVKEALK